MTWFTNNLLWNWPTLSFRLSQWLAHANWGDWIKKIYDTTCLVALMSFLLFFTQLITFIFAFTRIDLNFILNLSQSVWDNNHTDVDLSAFGYRENIPSYYFL